MCQPWSGEDSAEQFLASPACPPAVVPLVTSMAVHKSGLAAVSFSWIYASKYLSDVTVCGQARASSLSLRGLGEIYSNYFCTLL